MTERLTIPYRVFLKEYTEWEPARHLFPDGIPCVIAAKHTHPETGEEVYGWRVYQEALSTEQHQALIDCIHPYYDVEREAIEGGTIYIKDTHVKSACDESWVIMDAKVVYLADKATRHAIDRHGENILFSGLELHYLIYLLQVAFRHPGTQTLKGIGSYENFCRRLVSLTAKGDKEVEEFYNKGFDESLDVEIPSVPI